MNLLAARRKYFICCSVASVVGIRPGVCVCVCVCVCVSTDLSMCVCVYVYMCVCMYVCDCESTDLCPYIFNKLNL